MPSYIKELNLSSSDSKHTWTFCASGLTFHMITENNVLITYMKFVLYIYINNIATLVVMAPVYETNQMIFPVLLP